MKLQDAKILSFRLKGGFVFIFPNNVISGIQNFVLLSSRSLGKEM